MKIFVKTKYWNMIIDYLHSDLYHLTYLQVKFAETLILSRTEWWWEWLSQQIVDLRQPLRSTNKVFILYLYIYRFVWFWERLYILITNNHVNFSTNQLVIVDLMLGTFVRMEKPMADNDDINDLCICSGAKSKITGGHRFVLFNNKYFRYYLWFNLMTLNPS